MVNRLIYNRTRARCGEVRGHTIFMYMYLLFGQKEGLDIPGILASPRRHRSRGGISFVHTRRLSDVYLPPVHHA